MFVSQKKNKAREIIYGINAAITAIETTPEKILAARREMARGRRPGGLGREKYHCSGTPFHEDGSGAVIDSGSRRTGCTKSICLACNEMRQESSQ